MHSPPVLPVSIIFHGTSSEQLKVKEDFQKEKIDYKNKDNSKLRRFLSERCLSTHGTREQLITRLENSSIRYEDLTSTGITEMLRDRRVRRAGDGNKEYEIERLRINDKIKCDTGILEAANATKVGDQEERRLGHDSKFQRQAEKLLPTPVCRYNWEDSPWAEKTERQLTKICKTRGMPGGGPKAAKIKWLDTGNVDYEDMYTTELAIMCMERGLKYKSKDKKVDLVRLLREADQVQ